jgi:FtsP/CotA-like multicopper oxidase with cupredoxin domain
MTRRPSKLRRALSAAAVLAVAALPIAASAAGWTDPPAIVSRDGILDTTMVLAPRALSFDGAPLDAELINGLYPGPVLRVRPGDTMRIQLVNHLAEPANLHFHGIQTSPLGNSDNILVVVPPGESFRYEIRIPEDQPPGLYWYHAHIHGLATRQVTGGLSGALVVEGLEKTLPAAPGLTERLFVLKDAEYEDDDPRVPADLHGVLQTINGQTRVEPAMRPGETQFWRFSNQSANLYFHLTLRGHRFRVVAEDGVRLRQPRETETLDLGPASRMEALVDAGAPGDYDLVSDKVLTGDAMSRVLGSLHVGGETIVMPPATVPPAWSLEDLRQRTITARRTVVFTEDDAAEIYRIDGKVFAHGRIDTRVPLGSTEEWTIKNDTDDMHVFHIHQLAFQVVAINGEPRPFNGYLDNVRVPERGTVTLLLPFTRREMIGTFVYHCHVLKHEDKGMMAAIQVYDPAAGPPPDGGLDTPLRWLRRRLAAAWNGLPLEYCGLR